MPDNTSSTTSDPLTALGEGLTGAPVSSAMVASQPSVMPVSDSIDKSATSALLGTMQQSTISNPATAPAATTGVAIVPDDKGISQLVVGQYAQSPEQLEAAGILKPGSSALVNSAIAGGSDVQTAIPPNLFTGAQGVNNLDDYINNPTVQATVAVTTLQQSQTQLTNAGLITGTEDPSQISGVVLSGATAGIPETLNAVQCASSYVPNTDLPPATTGSLTPVNYGTQTSSPLSALGASISSSVSSISGSISGRTGSIVGGISGSFNSLSGGGVSINAGSISGASGRIMATISKGNFAAVSASVSIGSLKGLSVSLSALSKTPSLASLSVSVRGASASAFYAIAASFRPMVAGVPQNLTILARKAAATTAGASSVGASVSITNGLASLTGSVSGALSGGIGGVSASIGPGGSLSVSGGVNLPIGGGGGVQTAIGYNSSTGFTGVRSGSVPISGIGSVGVAVNNMTPVVGGYASSGYLASSAEGLYQTAQASNSGALQVSVSSMASGVSLLPGGSGTVASVVNRSSGIAVSLPGSNVIGSLARNISSSILNKLKPNNNLSSIDSIANVAPPELSNITPDLSGVSMPDISSSIDQANGDLSSLASTGLSAADSAKLESSVAALGSGGTSPVKMPTVAVNTVDRSDITAGIKNQLGDPAIPAPNFLGEVSPAAISEAEKVSKEQATATDAVDKINAYNTQVKAAYDEFSQAVLNYPQGDPRIAEAHQKYISLSNAPQLAELYSQAGIPAI